MLWHLTAFGAVYADAFGKVIGLVREVAGLHRAEIGGAKLGDYIDLEAGKAAVETVWRLKQAMPPMDKH